MSRILAVVLLCLAALFGSAADARADSNDFMHDAALFCRWLDGDSSPAGVARAVNEFTVQQVPYDVATATMVYALMYMCPEHQWAVSVAHSVYNGPAVLR